MLFLLLDIGTETYALAAEQVVEILPLLPCKRIPRAPAGLAGVFNYHGAMVSLIDLGELMLGKLSPNKMSTRIILANYGREAGKRSLLGLIAEGVTETMRRGTNEFVDSGVSVADSPYLGPVTVEKGRLIQRIEFDRLLPESLSQQLFQQHGGWLP
jgi:chemotaxis-related protein WspB